MDRNTQKLLRESAPTAGSSRDLYAQILQQSFAQRLKTTSTPTILYEGGLALSIPFFSKILPGGIGSYDYGEDFIKATSRWQSQDNPLIHTCVAQMLIEINNLDKILGVDSTVRQINGHIQPEVERDLEKHLEHKRESSDSSDLLAMSFAPRESVSSVLAERFSEIYEIEENDRDSALTLDSIELGFQHSVTPRNSINGDAPDPVTTARPSEESGELLINVSNSSAIPSAQQNFSVNSEQNLSIKISDSAAQGLNLSHPSNDSMNIAFSNIDSTMDVKVEKSGADPDKSAGSSKKIDFQGNYAQKDTAQISHDQQDPISRAIAYLVEILMLILTYSTSFRAEASFNMLAKIYQQKITELVSSGQENQAAAYINQRLLNNNPASPSELDPHVRKALCAALGLPQDLKEVKPEDLRVISDKKNDQEKRLAIKSPVALQPVICEPQTAAAVHIAARQEYYKEHGSEASGKVSYKIVGDQEQLMAIKKMNQPQARRPDDPTASTAKRQSSTAIERPSAPKENMSMP